MKSGAAIRHYRCTATANALPGGVLHTGNVGYMDDLGWFYIADRKKGQISAGGYKV